METARDPRLICIGAVVLHEDRVLFVRQAPGHPLAGQWSIPWGVVDEGESPSDAVHREVLEESGVVAEIVGLLGMQELREPGGIGLVFLCRHVSGIPTPDGVEVDDARYLSLNDIKSLAEPFESWCQWLAHRVLTGGFHVIPKVPDNPYRPRIAYL